VSGACFRVILAITNRHHSKMLVVSECGGEKCHNREPKLFFDQSNYMALHVGYCLGLTHLSQWPATGPIDPP